MTHPWTHAAVLAALALAACAQGSQPTCFADADCASGLCLPSGQCAEPAQDTGGSTGDHDVSVDSGGSDQGADGALDAGSSDPGSPDSAAGEDLSADSNRADLGGPDRAGDSDPRDTGDGLCRPNHDGVISATEVPVVLGLNATFRATQDVTVTTTGAAQGDGGFLWDFSSPLAGDHDLVLTPQEPSAFWFGDRFANPTYVTRLRDSEDELGIYQTTSDAVLLLGVASPEDGISRTVLEHDPPVTVFSLPFEVGDTWETNASVSGQALGLPSLFRERYRSVVDARGELITPFGRFPVLRVNVELTRTVGLLVTTYRSQLYVAECFGSVAVVHSQQDEVSSTFSDAAEILRLTP